jgi:hypothetical protein
VLIVPSRESLADRCIPTRQALGFLPRRALLPEEVIHVSGELDVMLEQEAVGRILVELHH